MFWTQVIDLDTHVRQCLATYSTMWRTRLDVLHHIFIVGGSGYEWGKDGELYVLSGGNLLLPVEGDLPPDVLTNRPYPWAQLATQIPENARPELRAAALEILAVWEVALAEYKRAKAKNANPAVRAFRQRIVDIVLYGDIHEAPLPVDIEYPADDLEAQTRVHIAATILAMELE